MHILLNFGLLSSQTTACFFSNLEAISLGGQIIFAHLRKFGLCMHVGRGDTASKTEAMYFPPPRTAYEAADTSRFYVDGNGFIDFCEKF